MRGIAPLLMSRGGGGVVGRFLLSVCNFKGLGLVWSFRLNLLCYSKGDGVNQNKVKAFQWYLKASEQGLVQAQFNVGSEMLHI
jgi:hypothetical protein